MNLNYIIDVNDLIKYVLFGAVLNETFLFGLKDDKRKG